jgi:probable LLM family oxidoreductase
MGLEIGIYDFAEVYPDPRTGDTVVPAQRLRDIVEEAELAEQVGLDVYGLGEHHRAEMVISAPAVVLAAVAARTHRIRLTSAVTVLSSDDPVRVFQDFATLDLISNGRAEIMAGRGSFVESFPLFGYDLDDYDELFAEKIELLLRIRDSERLTWSGRHRPPVRDQGVYPRPLQDPMPIWIAVGGNPQSVVRAGRLGTPLAIAIIGGQPARFVPLAELYREAAARAGHDPTRLAVSINSHTFVAPTAAEAADGFYPHYAAMMSEIGRERGWLGGFSRPEFDAATGPDGALLVGTPEQVAEKIVAQHKLFGHDRFLAQVSVGNVPHHLVMRAIELLGTEVAPLVRHELADA